MKPHEMRVVAEKEELDARRDKLAVFIQSHPEFNRLDAVDQLLLRQQQEVMKHYSGILGARIVRFACAAANVQPTPPDPANTSVEPPNVISIGQHQLVDRLDQLFLMQRALNLRIGLNFETLTDGQKTEWVLNFSRAMTQEIAELVDSVPWKWWAKYQKFDAQNARVEVVDLLHFLISVAQVLGMSADDLFTAYVKKNEVNFLRQDAGYAAKDTADSSHI